ncbi:response regulator transcription factor [Cohnella hongkongensis]|uniref:Response regulator n=1 Tax=Cohnella hongkongensis TaxID=178337 RepID=A0ABV9F921_9BACL
MNILIVDDEKLIRQGLSHMIPLMNENYRIVGQCGSGEEALERIAVEGLRVDVVITDVRMPPPMDGLELITELAIRYPHVRSIVISGYNEFDYVRSALRSGAVDYLLKPIDKKELQTVLGRIEPAVPSADSREPGDGSGQVSLAYRDNLLNGLFKADPGIYRDAVAYLQSRYGISESTHRFMTAGIVIDQLPDEPLTPSDKALFQYFIRKTAEELLPLSGSVEGSVFQGSDGLTLIVFFIDRASGFELQPQAQLTMLLGQIKRHVRYPITVALSSYVESFRQFPSMIDQLHIALKSRLVRGTDQLIEFDAARQMNEAGFEEVGRDWMESVTRHLQAGELEKMKSSFLELLADLRRDQLPPDYIVDMIDRMFIRMESALDQLGITVDSLNYEERRKLGHTLEQCPLWEQMERSVRERLDVLTEQIRATTLRQKPDYIKEAVAFIENRYREDIKLHDVAKHVHLFPSYFSQQFKLLMGTNFIDYLTERRMEEAMKLLRETDEPAYLICERVGYATSAHFIKVFKKWVGSTPAEYRNKWQTEAANPREARSQMQKKAK